MAQGILRLLRNDIAWQLLPPELGFCSGQICWRRLKRWQQAGVFDQLHRILLAERNAASQLAWSRAWASSARACPQWHFGTSSPGRRPPGRIGSGADRARTGRCGCGP
ncbi:transposase [Streptomyces sp. AP-93]|uniref:transposase n=1 Tax=Streptomyces sp. AP-93 TaxID=2929048 RepID=UPI0035AE89B0